VPFVHQQAFFWWSHGEQTPALPSASRVGNGAWFELRGGVLNAQSTLLFAVV
jgi:hypothetical protein